MSGFDNAGVDKAFFAGTRIQSNFIRSIGYGKRDSLFPRSLRGLPLRKQGISLKSRDTQCFCSEQRSQVGRLNQRPSALVSHGLLKFEGN